MNTNPRTLRLFLASLGFGAVLAAGAVGASVARADGYLSDTEYAYVNLYGRSAVCPVIGMYPSEAGVIGVLAGVIDDGFTPDNAADIVNASVSTYCPQFWGLLTEIGDRARARTDQRTAVA